MAARLIAHVDMDAFYAAVEQMDHPELRGKPVAVGPDPKGGKGRGVITTASYEARKFGIRSAMPVSTAYRLCPHAIFVPPRFKRYAELSAIVMECLGEFSPLVETVSIDEAFLDCTGTESLFGSPSELGRKIKARIRERTGLTASAGMAGCKSVAKVASDLQKPDGLTIVPEGGEKAFLAPLP
ncbi:MAG TPA: DNA polymerase IV, partial [Leptospiraceae bacterium]|nr:DNA polymerase IV [Leptospiraceae bacterium]